MSKLTKILGTFHKTVKELEKLVSANETAISKNDAVIAKLEVANEDMLVENTSARSVMAKLKDLVNA